MWPLAYALSIVFDYYLHFDFLGHIMSLTRKMLNFLRNLGPTELIIIGVILIVFFGSKKIADLGKTAGETTKEFKKIKKEYTEAVTEINKGEVIETEKEGDV